MFLGGPAVRCYGEGKKDGTYDGDREAIFGFSFAVGGVAEFDVNPV